MRNLFRGSKWAIWAHAKTNCINLYKRRYWFLNDEWCMNIYCKTGNHFFTRAKNKREVIENKWWVETRMTKQNAIFDWNAKRISNFIPIREFYRKQIWTQNVNSWNRNRNKNRNRKFNLLCLFVCQIIV